MNLEEMREAKICLTSCTVCNGFGPQWYAVGMQVEDVNASVETLIAYNKEQRWPINAKKMCNCANELARLQAVFAALPVVERGSWEMLSSSIPRRGIRDYGRTLTFSRELTDDEVETIRKLLRLDNCPGWTGVMIRKNTGHAYYATTTWDSSD